MNSAVSPAKLPIKKDFKLENIGRSPTRSFYSGLRWRRNLLLSFPFFESKNIGKHSDFSGINARDPASSLLPFT